MSGKYGDHPMSVYGTIRISPACNYTQYNIQLPAETHSVTDNALPT